MKELYSDNYDKVSGCIDDLFSEDSHLKSSLSNNWQRNVNFANGNQLLNFGSAAPTLANNQFQINLGLDSRQNLYITNEIEPIMRTMVAYVTRQKPGFQAFGASRRGEDRMKALLAEKVNEAKYHLDNEITNSRKSAYWAFSTGTSIRKDFWDYSIGRDAEIPEYDMLGNEVIDPETGLTVMTQRKTGGNSVAILTPFTITVDNSETDPYEQPYIFERYIMPLEWAQEVFDQDLPGYTGKARDIKEDQGIGDVLGALEQLKYATPYAYSATKPNMKGKCIVSECYIKPSKTYPYGRLAIKAGGVIVYDSPPELGSPYFMPVEPVMWHPYTFFMYEPYIGRFWGKSLVEQLIPLQMRLNEINGAILENANTLAKPNVMAHEGQMKRGIMNGKGANVYTWKQVGSATPPFILQGAPLPAQFFNEKQVIIEQMVRIIGTNFVMQGQPPQGVSAAAAIEQLLENANTQHSPLMDAFETYHTEGFTKKIRLIRKYQDLPVQELDDYIKQIAGDTLKLERDSFTREDLSDGIGIQVEAGSMIPKSHKAQRETYIQLADKGMFGAIQEDSPRGAKLRDLLLERIGEQPLDTEDSIELKRAKWENETIQQGGQAQVNEFDIAAIHLPCHKNKYQDPQFQETATDEQKMTLYQHIKEHEAFEQQKALEAQAQAMQAALTGGMAGGALPPGLSPGGGLPPQAQPPA